ncbi:MAG: NAD(P)/FAD-dependent oxidoreductase [Acidobacteria bacterium]|nr:NAD(P)/FAD-dependent oxidoreductase [Acidobacteriota bacterium]MCB9398059.1 NAD(P)/FAD-dependent oxidoreductase [Acidobacteriota bacterium]
MQPLVIIGNGISGVTLALEVRKQSDLEIVVISSESPHFYSRPALMYIFMGHLGFDQTKPYEDWFWQKNRIQLVYDHVDAVDIANQSLLMRRGQPLKYGQLVIACGAKSNFFGWPGQDLQGVQGLYGLEDLKKLETLMPSVQNAVIVGGGLIGVELAEMLLSRRKSVTFLVRENHYWGNVLPREEAELVGREIVQHGVDLRFNQQLASIEGDGKGCVQAIHTQSGERIPCQFVGITTGVSPNIGFLKDSGIDLARGVLVNAFFETNVPHVFAIGDCAEFRDKQDGPQVEQLWYTGKLQAEQLAANLTGQKKTYQRGIWFNSAKFFDIEYHTYGRVSAFPQTDEIHFYWEHPDGRKSLRLVGRKNDRVLVGMNAFGIRYRHRVFEHWIQAGLTLEQTMAQLLDANFDPEFFKRYEPQMVEAFNRAFPEHPVQLRRKTRWWPRKGA